MGAAKSTLSRISHAHTQVPRAKTSQESRFPKLEARCQSTRNQGHASLPHPAPRRLPQVQQALRLPTLLCPSHIPPARPGPLPKPHGGTAPLQALRHGRPKFLLQALRHRKQAHRRRLLPTSSRRLHVHVQNGRIRQRSREIHRARPCPRRPRHRHRPRLPRHQTHGRLCHMGRHLQAQTHHYAIQRRARRFRSSLSLITTRCSVFCTADPQPPSAACPLQGVALISDPAPPYYTRHGSNLLCPAPFLCEETHIRGTVSLYVVVRKHCIGTLLLVEAPHEKCNLPPCISPSRWKVVDS